MDINSNNIEKNITCTTEGAYPDGLTYGQTYKIIDYDEVEDQIKIRGDNGKISWYSSGHFDITGGDVPKIVRILHVDSLDNPIDWVEVNLELSNGQHRWCFFITPDLLQQNIGNITFGSERLLSHNAPHMIVVSALNQQVFEMILKYIESQGELLDCTKLIGRCDCSPGE